MSGAGGVFHADDMIAAIDMMDLAGDAAGEIGQRYIPAPPTSSMVTLRSSGALNWFQRRI